MHALSHICLRQLTCGLAGLRLLDFGLTQIADTGE
jgi:hypothetical protein